MKWRFYILLVFLALVFGTSSVYSQRIQGAVIAGMNLSQVDGDEVYGFKKPGANVGLSAIVPFGKSFEFSIETLFNQKGANQKTQYASDTLFSGAYKLKLNYLEVPVLLMYNDKDIITAGAGFSYGRLVSVSEYEHGKKVESTTLTSGTYNRNDYNILADVRFRIYKRFRLNLRYAYSLAKIRTRDFYTTDGDYDVTRKQYNNVISLRIVYRFNENPPISGSKNDNAGF
jgi:hypothetical protein